MKKAIAAMLALGMTLTMCGGTLVVRAEGDAKTYKVLSGSGEGVAAYDYSTPLLPSIRRK